MQKSRAIFYRGLPGSKKTTKARRAAEKTNCLHIDFDSLLVKCKLYDFSYKRHRSALEEALEIIAAASRMGADFIVSEVLASWEEIEYCILPLDPDQYDIFLIDCDPGMTVEESMRSNVHNVLRSDIEAMANRWEPAVCIAEKLLKLGFRVFWTGEDING